MKTIQKISQAIVVLILISQSKNSYSQIATSTTYNYFTVNINSFPIDRTGATTTNYENDYLYSGLYICQKLASTIATYNVLTTYPKSFNINNPTTNVPFFNVVVSEYCKEMPGMPNFKYRMVFIRPAQQGAALVKRRTILISNGVGSSISKWGDYYVECVHDFLMRGYAVAVIEHVTSDFNTRYGSLQLANLGGHGCTTTNPTLNTYSSTQFATAAVQYLRGMQNANAYGVDTNNIYAVGHSWGSFGVYGLAYAKQSNFPGVSTLSACTSFSPSLYGDLDNLTLDPYKTKSKSVKAIGILGGSISAPGPNQTNIFDPSDANVPAIIMHGVKDQSILIDFNNTTGYNTAQIKQQLMANSIPWLGFAMCNGGHEVVTYNGLPNNATIASGDYITSQQVDMFNNNNFLNNANVGKPYSAASVTYFNTLANNQNLIKYAFLGKQIYDIGYYTAWFFSVVDNCKAPTDPTLSFRSCIYSNFQFPGAGTTFSYVKTTSFPFNYSLNQYNGHFTGGNCAISNLRVKNSEADIPEADIEIGNSIEIYPLPAESILNINFTAKKSGYITMSMFDITGKNVLSIINNESFENGTHNKQLDISNLPNGMYKLIMKTSGEEIITKTVLIQK